jgi:hypothetical protein
MPGIRDPLQADDWWRHPLAREIAVVLAVKLALLFLLWWLFFDLPADRQVDTDDVRTFITGSPTTAGQAKEIPR